MPQLIFLAIIESAAAASIGSTATIAVATVAAAGASAAIAVAPAIALSVASNLLFAPSIPKQDGQFPLRQPIPPRQAGYGSTRLSGFYMLYEVSSENHSRDVLAIHDGQIDSIQRYYLNTDEVTLQADGRTVNALPDGRYSTGHVLIETRLGLPIETAYAEMIGDLPGLWTSEHRGDGIASLALYSNSTSSTNFAQYYPNGLPQPSVLARLRRVWDFRLPAQSPTDPTTWAWSPNPILALCHYLCFAGDGPGFDYAQRIVPQLASWIEAASVCEEIVGLKVGGNEPRYQCGGIYRYDNNPSDIIKSMLDSCDGWIGEDGAGGLKCYAGKFYAPTITIPADHILGYNLPRFVPDEQAINELGFSYTEPGNAYATVDGDAWIDEGDVEARGKIRSQRADMPWVQSHSQGRRLAKRAVMRANAERSGTITTNLYGLQALGERYLNFVIPELPSLANGFVVEVRKVSIDLSNLQLTFTVIGSSAAIDEWDPLSEEGNAPVIPVSSSAGLPPTPVDVTVAIDTTAASSVDQGVQLDVTFAMPNRSDLTFGLRYQVDGAGDTWTEQSYSPSYPGGGIGTITLRTGFVALNQTYDVQARTVGPRLTPSDWSATVSVNTSASVIAPASPSGLAVVAGAAGSGQATVSWRNPSSANLDHCIVYRASGGAAFSTAVAASGPITGGLGAPESFTDTGLAAGAYSYWVAALNAASAASAPAGPVNVTVS